MKKAALFACCGLAVLLGSTGWSQVTQRVSVASVGTQGNGFSAGASFHAQNRFVLFDSTSSNLVPGDTNGSFDSFIHDLRTGTTERLSVATGGAEGNSGSFNPSITVDGRFASFTSYSSNLVPNDGNGTADVYVRDRRDGITELLSIDLDGHSGNGPSVITSISSDGRFVAFQSLAWNLVPDTPHGLFNIFVRDRQLSTTEMISFGVNTFPSNGSSFDPTISADGRFVAFYSEASNLVAGDTNGVPDIFVRDRLTGTTERVSVATGGSQGNATCLVGSTITPDGRLVVFNSLASNLVAGDANDSEDVFVRDRLSGTTERVSVASDGGEGNTDSSSALTSISSDGRCVVFWSYASNLVPGDTNGKADVFVRDRRRGTTELASVASDGAQGDADSGYAGSSISADGRLVSFESHASNLVASDTNGDWDIFVHDRNASGFTSICDPDVSGVIGCPCSNAPSGPAQGCDNSSATGGAMLAASGLAYLSMESLVFTTSGETPTATSILLQGDALATNGIAFGQGVRCVDGTLKRLYTKTAVGGSITAPDFGAGDPTVSARSAALGDTISPGQSRYYLVYYRDPIVLGGCPASSTFNATQTGQVVWSL